MRDIGLDTHSKKMAKDLSGGNRRKLSVALALIADS
jgi:ABC-type multidrug transport system ATPase subunit